MKPDYWDRAKRALSRRDPVMGAIMRVHPKIFLARRGEPFLTLARAIVGQQISVKAAQSVWNRIIACVPLVSPEQVLAVKRAELRACGLSDRKVEYIAELVEVRGIGRWTAEMFLIFNLLRPDVFPLDDLGLQKGIRLAYFKGRKVSAARMKKLGETWRPWRSVATWYLWRSLD